MTVLFCMDFSCTWKLNIQQKNTVFLTLKKQNLEQTKPLESKGKTLERKKSGQVGKHNRV